MYKMAYKHNTTGLLLLTFFYAYRDLSSSNESANKN